MEILPDAVLDGALDLGARTQVPFQRSNADNLLEHVEEVERGMAPFHERHGTGEGGMPLSEGEVRHAADLDALVWMMALYALLAGAIQIVLALRMRQLAQEMARG